MMKITTLAVVVGLVSVATVLPSTAQQNNIPGTPNYPSESEDEEHCSGRMGFSPPISPAQVNAINDQRVWLHPICEDGSLTRSEDVDTLFIDGNASTLRREIARNPTLMAELTEHDYDQHDVISVVYGANNSILLYVHQREVR